jgi:aspartyl-tRNA(Asn)/glutamyl-tRNA(Gln) amidotransferase subunit B
MSSIARVDLKVGMEIHVELATRTKMFTRVASPAHAMAGEPEPNTLIDPVVLGLPGALPVLNKAAIDMSIMVGLALGCSIAPFTKWDRKSYFYPDLPKNYQISQYDLPLCFDGSVDVAMPGEGDGETSIRIGIIRAHLEEDAGKLLHEAPGGHAIDHSIIDLNRAGTPLLEIVTAPDFTSADQVVAFAQMLRNTCRFLGVTEGVMQKGHMRFEPNINCVLIFDDGRRVVTPIVEVKNLNSFKSLRGAIDYELREQPRRYLEDGRVMAAGAKTTRGWDDVTLTTFLQREKEDAHDYRYFPDPDLPPVRVTEAWREEIRARLPELPHTRERRYRDEFGLGAKEAAALVEERETCLFFEATIDAATDRLHAMHAGESLGALRERAGKLAANLVLQSGFKRANERGARPESLGISPARIAEIAILRDQNLISAQAADALFGELCEHDEAAHAAAERLGLLQVRDDAALGAWVDATIADPANDKAVADIRAGKQQAIGRLVGDVMKRSGGKADAKAVREMLLDKLK